MRISLGASAAALDAADQPVMPAATRHSMTILLTGSQQVPAVRHDAVAAFARRYPSTVTPIAPH